MTEDAARRAVAEYWFGRADASLLSAASELAAGRFDFAVNRAYYVEARQAADYLELVELEQAHAAESVDLARGFVMQMRRLFAPGRE